MPIKPKQSQFQTGPFRLDANRLPRYTSITALVRKRPCLLLAGAGFVVELEKLS